MHIKVFITPCLDTYHKLEIQAPSVSLLSARGPTFVIDVCLDLMTVTIFS